MEKKKRTGIASGLIWLSFLCLPLTEQTAAGIVIQSVKPFEKTRPEKAEIRESEELQLRMIGRAWPGSAVTYTTAGERLSKEVYTYNDDGNLTLSISYTWKNSQWTESSKSVYTYDDNGILISSGSYNRINNTWVKSDEKQYKYDPEPTSSLMASKASIIRDLEGNFESKESETYRGDSTSGKWTDFVKEVNTHDTNGGVFSFEHYTWDTSSDGWIGVEKFVNTLDTNRNLLSSEHYTWDTSSEDWIGIEKQTSTYNTNGRELSSESYNWDTTSGDWIGNNRTTLEERNKYGDVILSKSWSWKNNGWEWTSYTVNSPDDSDTGYGTHRRRKAGLRPQQQRMDRKTVKTNNKQ
jgi:hypothetical protein